MRVEEIPTIEGLERIGGEWGELWGKSGMGTPFQSPWWLIPWWRHIGEGELWTLAFREESDAGQGGRLVGLLPLYIYTRPGTRIRKLFLLGISSSDYLDALVLPEYAGRVMAAAMEYLDAHRERWDVCDLQQLAAGSPLCDMTVPAGWVEKSSESEPCLVVSLAEGMGGLDCCVPGTMVQNLRYYRRRAERQGTWQVEGADSHNVEEMLEALLRLHRARWSMRSMPGVLDQAGVEGFHREAVGGLLSAGMLRLYGLRFEGRLISVLYGLFDPREWGRRFYYYLGGFDPGYERLSPGTLVIGHAMEQAAGEGAREFDFLRGCERYKYLWGAKNTATYRRRLWHAARQASDVMPELQCCDDRS